MANKKRNSNAPGYEVGFGKPPAHTRFRKGESGNPKGRPKGRRNVATALQAALNERVMITENGQRKAITKLDAAIKQVVNKAAAGESASVKVLLQLFPFLDQHLDDRSTQTIDPQADRQVLSNIVARLQSAPAPVFPDTSVASPSKGKVK